MKITKRQLRRIIREEAETVGVVDVSKTEDAFGGGEAEIEAFVDVEPEELLNQSSDEGAVSDVIPERRTRKISRSRLRKIIQEQAGGLPSVDDLAKKLGAAGPEAALDFVQRLLMKANFNAPEAEEVEVAADVSLPTPPVEPPEDV